MIDINELRQSLGAVQPEEVAELLDRIEAAEKERDALRAKIEAMEQQEPVAWMLNCQTLGGDTGWILPWTQSGAGLCNRLQGEENEKRLYALPGAQPAPSALVEAIIADMQAQYNSEMITENDSGEALIRLDGAIAAVEDNFALAQPSPTAPELLELLRCACNYIDKLGGVSQQYRAMLAAASEAKP